MKAVQVALAPCFECGKVTMGRIAGDKVDATYDGEFLPMCRQHKAMWNAPCKCPALCCYGYSNCKRPESQ